LSLTPITASDSQTFLLTMMRSMTLLSSTVAIAMASSESAVGASNAPQQELWYPEFASDYESGSCTTSPSSALMAFAKGAVNPESSALAQEEKANCCETWFPEQELCGCLGGCAADENDSAHTLSVTAEPLTEEQSYWYPQFDVTYEEGKCVKMGVNTDNAPPSYYTKEGGFLDASLDNCCERWFEYQQTKTCLTVDLGDVAAVAQPPTASMTSVNATSMVEDESAAVHYEWSRLAMASEETL